MTGPALPAVPWGPVAAGSALGAVCVALDRWLVPDGPGSALLWFGLAGFASASAFTLDEAAAAVVDAVPRSRRWRTVRRLAIGLLPLVGWLLVTALSARSSDLSWAALAVTGGGLVAVTLAVATALRRLGQATPGDVVSAGVGGAVLLGLLVAVPKVGPVLEAYDAGHRSTVWWLVLMVAAVAGVVWGSADPFAARPRRRAGRDRARRRRPRPAPDHAGRAS